MRITTFIFSLSLLFLPMTLMAGSGHDHEHNHNHSHEPVTQGQAEQVASKVVLQLAEKGKIDSSWKTIQVEKSLKKKFGQNTEWVVSFNNKTISDSKKQTLYVFLTLTGDYIAANYSGN